MHSFFFTFLLFTHVQLQEQRQEIELADAAQAAIQSPLADSPLVSGNTPGGKSL
jgi:hypothetical protein